MFQVKQLFISLLLKISRWWQTKTKRIYNVAYDQNSTIDRIGIVPLESDKELDYPATKLSQQSNFVDGISFRGFNQEGGDCLVVQIARRPEDKVDVVLYLKLSDGSKYKLPNLPDTRAYTSDAQNFSSCGLKIQCLSAMARWRIAYNGLLRKVQDGNEEKDEIVHVRFSLVWTTASLIFDFQTDFNCELLAEGLSKDQSLFLYSALNNLKQRLDCFEHWGQFAGTICIGAQEEKEIYLWGPRTRNKGILDWREIEHYESIYGQMKDGTKFHLGTVSISGIVSKLKYGYIILPNHFIHSVECCYYDIAPEGEKIPNKIIFKAGGKTYNIYYHQLNDGLDAYFGENWNISSKFRYTLFALNDFEGKGFVETGTRNKTVEAPRSTQKKPCLLREPVIEDVDISWVVDFTEKSCQSSKVSGGKGSSLAMLTELSTIRQNTDDGNFVVPKGIVVTSAAYRYHLSLNLNLLQEISSLSSNRDLKDMERTSQILMAAFIETSLSDKLKTAILQKLEHVFPQGLSDKTFAVRSSASGEDSEDTSAAGQMETFLGIKTIDEICENVIKCWSSQFSLTAINYKRQTGQVIDADMAVVIQEMVSAEVAGVAFTCDPLTCNPENITITANYGLGESVVSAAADPDTIILKRSVDNNLVFHSETIGKKNIRIQLSNEGGTATENVLDEDSNKCSLKREDSLKIGRAAILIEESFGNPRDIEWAIVRGQLYLLQARPITTCDVETDFQIIHELDSGHITEAEYLTKANIGEVMPSVVSPLTGSTILKLMDVTFQNGFFGLKHGACVYHPNFPATIFSYGGKKFLHVLETIFRQVTKEDNAVTTGSQWTWFGRVIENFDELKAVALHRYGEFPALLGITTLISNFIGSFSLPKQLEETYNQTMKIYIPENRKFFSSQELYIVISHLLPKHCKAVDVHSECSGFSSLCNILIMAIMARSAGEMNERLFFQFSRLLSNCENIESADVPQSMKDLVDSIISHGAKEKILGMKPEEVARWLHEEKSQLGAKYRNFLRQHGHRCFMEFDMYSIPWSMNPVPLIKSLQSMIKYPSDRKTNRKKEDSPYEVLNEIPLDIGSKFLLKILVNWARKAVANRERSKSEMIRSIDVFRRAYRRLGKMMADEGRIPEEDLIFFLTHEEIGELLKTRSARLISKGVRRKRVDPELDMLRFPEIICGPPQPLEAPDFTAEDGTSDWVIKATPVSRGKVTAKARVIKSLDEAQEIQPGEILVVHCTDIGWTPYFPLLSGVVTELGGLISHGAVVAREFGLPCVVGAVNATSIIKSGDLIVLDGRNGTIKKVSTVENNSLE